jgi:hypothetical protein
VVIVGTQIGDLANDTRTDDTERRADRLGLGMDGQRWDVHNPAPSASADGGLGDEHPATQAPVPTQPAVQAPADAIRAGDGHAEFSAGYLDHGGDPSLLAHLLANVLPCESTGSDWIDWTVHLTKPNGYRSAAQFHPGSWATAVRHTSLGDDTDPYHVGANVATWIRLIGGREAAGTTSGWPSCWWRGLR